MGVDDDFSDIEVQREELIHEHFERQLKTLGLTEEEIKSQSLDELNQSLEKVNDAISHPDRFGKLKLQLSPAGGLVVVAKRKEAHMELGILPLLLERKSLILSRIRILVSKQRVSRLKELLGSLPDPQLRSKLESEVSSIEEQARQLTEQENAVLQAQTEQIAKRDDEALAKARLLRRRLRAWTEFFNKESVAVYVGALLVVILTGVQVVAMFLGYKSEIINNAFLLLLGYFFSQSVAQTATRQRNQDTGG
jgi:hypothetical protein